MDAHFADYCGAVAGMQELYGEPCDDQPTDFHEAPASESAGAELPVETVRCGDVH
jgi:hypothetical protein